MEWNKYIVLAIIWTIYFFLHSALANKRVKKFFSSEDNLKNARIYRIFYNLISTGGLFVIYLYIQRIHSIILFRTSFFSLLAGGLLLLAGVFIVYQAFKIYSFSGFVGILSESKMLKKEGILKHSRHPLYFATILLCLGIFLIYPRLAILTSVLMVFIYLPIGIKLEEDKLKSEFGAEYDRYRKEVPSVFPKIDKSEN